MLKDYKGDFKVAIKERRMAEQNKTVRTNA